MGKIRRALALLTVATLLLSALAAGTLARPQGTLAYNGQVSSTWYFGLTHPNSGCGYDVFVAYGYTARMFCHWHDSANHGYGFVGGNYQYLGCWTPGGCRFTGTINTLGWDWVADSVMFTYADDYSGWHGYIVNAWPT